MNYKIYIKMKMTLERIAHGFIPTVLGLKNGKFSKPPAHKN